MNKILTLLAATTLFAVAPAAHAAPLSVPMGDPFYVGLEAQLLSGKGLMTGAGFAGELDSLEMGGRILFYPQSFTQFFIGDASFMLAPRLGSLLDLELPVEIQPLAGLSGGMYMDEFVAPAGSTGTANAYIGVPIGARVMMGVGSAVVSAQALYHYQVFDVMPTQYGYTTNRLHLEVDARLGDLAGGVYYETGAFLSGPGLKVGLNF